MRRNIRIFIGTSTLWDPWGGSVATRPPTLEDVGPAAFGPKQVLGLAVHFSQEGCSRHLNEALVT